MTRTVYEIVAYPDGAARTVATLHGLNEYNAMQLEIAARVAGTTVGDEVAPMIAAAQQQAAMRGEYVDLYRDNIFIGTVGPEGVIE